MLKALSSWPSNNTGLNYAGPLTYRWFSTNMCGTRNVFSLMISLIILSLCSSWLYGNNPVYNTYNICVHGLLLVRLPANSRLLAVKLLGVKSYTHFLLDRRWVPLTSLFVIQGSNCIVLYWIIIIYDKDTIFISLTLPKLCHRVTYVLTVSRLPWFICVEFCRSYFILTTHCILRWPPLAQMAVWDALCSGFIFESTAAFTASYFRQRFFWSAETYWGSY